MHHVPHILKDYVDAYAHLCFSLLKCLSMSHPSLLGRASLYLPLLVLVAQHLFVTRLCLLCLKKSLLYMVVFVNKVEGVRIP